MFFCNMLGENGVGTFRDGMSVSFVNTEVVPVENSNIYLSDDKSKVLVKASAGQGNLFLKGLEGEESKLYNEKMNKELTIADVADTQENPLIVCLCSEITVFDGIPADFKYMYLSDEVALVMLISGKIGINGQNLCRCKDVSGVERKSRVFSAKALAALPNFVDEESGYNYIKDAVVHVRISYSSRSESVGYMGIQEDTEFLTITTLDNKREQARKKKKLIEERKAKLEAEKAERARKAEEARVAALKRKEEEVKKEASSGASEFLKAMGLR